ncbi:ATP-binding protein [Phenylobacterium sp. LjRoot219]|uniref:ATP-binding protein n=1 Tax=Phenylobacterium sp. LjRoot219 TaxID=3342283 RepID=UPI003ED075D3
MSRPPEGRSSETDGAAPDFATFFAVSLDLLVIRDSDFRIVKVNKAWETMLGYRTEELEGQLMLSFIHPDDVPASHGHMKRMETERDVSGFINRYRCRDGGYRHLEWRARRDGDLVYGVARDVTERLAIEAEMAAARVSAEAANRAKSDFLANMSHEIRTPLNGVIGVAAALAQTELAPAQREMVELILTSGSTLERVVSDVLDFSKIEAGKLEIEVRPFDLRVEFDKPLELFRLRADEKGLRLPVSYGATARGEFLGDVVRIKQVLGNLLSNALKFTAAGEVRVAVDVRDPGDGGPAELRLQVQDTGVGFDDAFAAKLFQRFSQADETITRRFGGTGLGLSICHALVEMMDGQIAATSRPGHGSTFEIRLPLPRCRTLADYDRAAPAPLAPLGAGEGAPLEALRVLLAEDHPINQRVVELILEPLGAILTTVETGVDAVSAFTAGPVDLVLMDMQMPGMDGLAATRAIRRLEAAAPERARTPIIMLSANAMRQHTEEAQAAGADLHLAKPVTAASLVAAVVRVLDEVP